MKILQASIQGNPPAKSLRVRVVNLYQIQTSRTFLGEACPLRTLWCKGLNLLTTVYQRLWYCLLGIAQNTLHLKVVLTRAGWNPYSIFHCFFWRFYSIPYTMERKKNAIPPSPGPYGLGNPKERIWALLMGANRGDQPKGGRI